MRIDGAARLRGHHRDRVGVKMAWECTRCWGDSMCGPGGCSLENAKGTDMDEVGHVHFYEEGGVGILYFCPKCGAFEVLETDREAPVELDTATNGELIDELITRFNADCGTMQLALSARGYVLTQGDDGK